LERRLKRPVTVQDFTHCPVNRLVWTGAGKLAVVIERERWDELDRQKELVRWQQQRQRRQARREQRDWIEKHQLALFGPEWPKPQSAAFVRILACYIPQK
jgi:hypothetical protein